MTHKSRHNYKTGEIVTHESRHNYKTGEIVTHESRPSYLEKSVSTQEFALPQHCHRSTSYGFVGSMKNYCATMREN